VRPAEVSAVALGLGDEVPAEDSGEALRDLDAALDDDALLIGDNLGAAAAGKPEVQPVMPVRVLGVHDVEPGADTVGPVDDGRVGTHDQTASARFSVT
jgi:hypothetical protein